MGQIEEMCLSPTHGIRRSGYGGNQNKKNDNKKTNIISASLVGEVMDRQLGHDT